MVCKPCSNEGEGTTNGISNTDTEAGTLVWTESTRVGCKITWMMNIDFGGAVPSLMIQNGMMDLMSYPSFVCEETKMTKGEKSALDSLSDLGSNKRFFAQYAAKLGEESSRRST